MITEPIIVMGLFDRFRKKVEEEEPLEAVEFKEPETLSVFYSDLESAVQDKLHAQKTQILQKFATINLSLQTNFDALKNPIQHLSSATFESDKKTQAVVNSIKQNYVNKALSQMQSLPILTPSSTYTQMQSFSEAASALMKFIRASSPKHAIVLSRFFKEESEALVKAIKATDDSLIDLKDFLEKDAQLLKNLDDFSLKLREFETLRTLHDEAIEKEKTETQRVDTIQGAVSKVRIQIEELEQTEEAKKLALLEDSIKQFSQQLIDDEGRLGTLLSHVTKPLDKYLYEGTKKGTLSKQEGAVIKNLTKHPVESAFQLGFAQIESILKEAKEATTEGHITLKPKERERLEELLSSSELKETLELYEEKKKALLEQQDALKKYSALIEKRRELENDLTRKILELNSMKKELPDYAVKVSDLENEQQQKRKNIESFIRERFNIIATVSMQEHDVVVNTQE